EPQPPSSLRPGVSPELDAVCRKALASKVRDRFGSMQELAEALQDALDPPENSSARRLSGAGRSRRRWWARVLFLVLVLVAGFTLTGTLFPLFDDRGGRTGTAGPSAMPAPEEKVGEVRRFEGHTAEVWSVALSSDGHQALSASFDKILRLWDVK